jgi:hypothetical protein
VTVLLAVIGKFVLASFLKKAIGATIAIFILVGVAIGLLLGKFIWGSRR